MPFLFKLIELAPLLVFVIGLVNAKTPPAALVVSKAEDRAVPQAAGCSSQRRERGDIAGREFAGSADIQAQRCAAIDADVAGGPGGRRIVIKRVFLGELHRSAADGCFTGIGVLPTENNFARPGGCSSRLPLSTMFEPIVSVLVLLFCTRVKSPPAPVVFKEPPVMVPLPAALVIKTPPVGESAARDRDGARRSIVEANRTGTSASSQSDIGDNIGIARESCGGGGCIACDCAVTNWLLASFAPQSVPLTTMNGVPLLVTSAPALPVEVSSPLVALIVPEGLVNNKNPPAFRVMPPTFNDTGCGVAFVVRVIELAAGAKREAIELLTVGGRRASPSP